LELSTNVAFGQARGTESTMFASGVRVLGVSVLEGGLLVVGACLTAALVLVSDKPLLYSGAAIGAALLLAYALSAVSSGNSQGLVLIWVLLYPLGYYYLSFPQEHSIFTLDRAFVAILAAVLIAHPVQRSQPLPTRILYAGLCWTGFIGAALLSLRDVRGWSLLYSLRVLIDAFVMPGVLALYVLRRFNVRRHLPALSIVVCVMSIYLAGIGMAEAVLHQDLLPLSPENTFLLGNDEIFRANGPFGSGSTYGLLGVINFLLIRFFQRTTGSGLPSWQRFLQWIGMLAAFLVSMIPMHRGIVVTWVVIGLIEAWQNRRNSVWWRGTAWKRAALLVGFSLALIAIKTTFPYIYEDRVEDASNVNARLAQHQQSLAVLLDHPWLGAGFGQFTQVVSNESKYRFFYNGVPSIDYPHNTLLNVAAETGLLGVFFFTLSQFFLLRAFRGFPLKGLTGLLAWWSFVSIFVAYWVFGMDVSSGYFEELNIWYMFALAICIRYACTEPYASPLDPVGVKAFGDRVIHT
jgi:O-antigen ligase